MSWTDVHFLRTSVGIVVENEINFGMLSFNSMHDIMNQFTLYLIHSKLLPKENKLLNLMINL